jgi:hypothetical protein
MVTIVTMLFATLAVFGLAIVLLGSMVTARAVIVKDEDAISIAGQSGFTGYSLPQPMPKQFRQQPAVRNLIRQSRHARFGLYLIAAGTFFQILGAVPSFFSHH